MNERQPRVYVYARVATKAQASTLEAQLSELSKHAESKGYKVVMHNAENIPNSISEKGKRGIVDAAKESKFDILLIKNISRLSRDLPQCLPFLNELDSCGIQIESMTEGLINREPEDRRTSILSLLNIVNVQSPNTLQNVPINFEGATCKSCGCNMLKSTGCAVSKVHVGGNVYDRIKVGAPGDFDEGMPETTRCHDCNALFGHLHHWGCDAERCPACGGQLISCDCEDVFIEG